MDHIACKGQMAQHLVGHGAFVLSEMGRHLWILRRKITGTYVVMVLNYIKY